MARTRSDARLQSRESRLKLKPRPEPYWRAESKGLAIGYYKGTSGGTWKGRYFTSGKRRIETIAIADDHADADGVRVLSWDQAQAKAREWRNHKDAEDTGVVVAGKFTVAEAVNGYISNLEKEKRKPQPQMWTTANAHILPTLGHIELKKLTHPKVKTWHRALADAAPRVRTGFVKEKVWVVNKRTGKGQFRDRKTTVKLQQAFKQIDTANPDVLRKRQATANRILTILKSALNYAKSELRVIATDTAWADVKPFKAVDVPRIRFMSFKEVAAFTDACTEQDFLKLAQGALLTGARYGELGRLTAEDFKPQSGRLHIAKSKNGESRDIDLNAEAVAFFAELTQRLDTKQRIFLRANGKTWKKSEQKRPTDAVCDAVGIEGVTFHILRHTYASHAAMAGMPIEVLAKQLGHKDSRVTTRCYAHLCPDHKQKVVQATAPTFGFKPVPEPAALLAVPEYPPLPANVRTGKLVAMAGR